MRPKSPLTKVHFVTYLTDLERAALQRTALKHHLSASEWSRKVLLKHGIDEEPPAPPKPEPVTAPLFGSPDDDEVLG